MTLQDELAQAKANIASARAEARAEAVKELTTATCHGVEVRVEGREAMITLDLDAAPKTYTNKAGKVTTLGPGIYKGTFGAAYQLAPGFQLYLSTVKK